MCWQSLQCVSGMRSEIVKEVVGTGHDLWPCSAKWMMRCVCLIDGWCHDRTWIHDLRESPHQPVMFIPFIYLPLLIPTTWHIHLLRPIEIIVVPLLADTLSSMLGWFVSYRLSHLIGEFMGVIYIVFWQDQHRLIQVELFRYFDMET